MATVEFRKSIAREYFESLVIAVVLALFIRTFVVQAFKIPTGSMEQNLLIGDHLLVNKFIFGPTLTPLERTVLPIKDIQRRDVIVFKYPEDPERDFIKRVIGLPGETVELRNKRVFINGQQLAEPYVYFLEDPPPIPQEMAQSGELQSVSGDPRVQYGPVTVPPGHYFVMGDNRDNSQDSRYWGFLPRENIKGRALVIYWSYDAGSDENAGTLPALVHMVTRTRWNRLLHQVR
ncbi:MAG TPA: signal peptidase I [Vicinamibacterales bacterium]|jgi:signal peptidase I|nr:signal peptidase I [Vicinamibacterales bacterium]